jgi:2-oxoisovalerate dehydrogenase E2 component (dihydrolipoyl transacylase)
MGIHVIKIPDIGEGIAKVELAAWHVNVGDTVVEDQALADVMTDKATVEIPSPVAGTVIARGGDVGNFLAVGSELIRLQVDGAGNQKTNVQENTIAEQIARAVTPDSTTGGTSGVTEHLSGTDEGSQDTVPVAHQPEGHPLASPAVRKRASDLGIDLRLMHGTGPTGRILHEDLDTYLQGREGTTAVWTGYIERNNEDSVPVIGLRRQIAQKMQEAKRHIPHFSYVEEIDVTELEDLRAQLNRKWGEQRGRLTVLPLLARAMAIALRDFPQINARFDDEAGIVTRYGAVHIGIATQSKAGLMVPVLRHAETRDLWSIGAEISRLAQAVRNGRPERDELSGATITITSLGALGGIVTTPVINRPEVAIVGVNRIVERPMIRNGAVVARKLMNLSSSFDHRVVDGIDAAEFIQAVRVLLEQPAMLFVE